MHSSSESLFLGPLLLTISWMTVLGIIQYIPIQQAMEMSSHPTPPMVSLNA